ncbi:kinase-like domain-containing protein [Geranomyces variabilis]|nr:kinase-like domain-containing protein [Geranomyces variabilis]KAJ3143554.1 Serine/threonine-protein kinase Nek1 [Geranomyces variabilis]
MDHYKIIRTIGVGSSGCVRLAHACGPGGDASVCFCIKEVPLDNLSKDEQRSALREAKILKKLPPHPNIVGFVDAFVEAGSLHIVLEHGEGGDLDAYLKSRKNEPLPEQQIWQWTVQLLLAVAHLHKHKVLHRDIKAKNIFISRDQRLQLGDFGIARALASTFDKAITAIGTPFYLSPEICDGKTAEAFSIQMRRGMTSMFGNSVKRAIDYRLPQYELATLRHAFEAPSLKELMTLIVEGQPQPISSHYSADLRVIVSLMLQTQMVCGMKGVYGRKDIPAVLMRSEESSASNQRSVQARPVSVAASAATSPTTKPKAPSESPNVPPTPSPNDSIFTRIEFARIYIERELGLDVFMKLYARALITDASNDKGSRSRKMVRQLVDCERNAYGQQGPSRAPVDSTARPRNSR